MPHYPVCNKAESRLSTDSHWNSVVVQSLELSLVGSWTGIAVERNTSANVLYQVFEIMEK